MVEQQSATPNYTMGYSEDFQQLLNLRSAETHARHLLPHLKQGLRVLDFGCGPGNISVGLARAVEPGEFHGIDMEASQIDMARAAAEAGGHTNATFHVGDATNLPFEDGYFDVAHCHTVLTHVPDTQGALAEVKRALKPGGIIASRELIVDSCFLAPGAGEIQPAWDVFAGLLAANGGHPQMDREWTPWRKRGLSTSPAPPASGGWRGQEQRDIETLPSRDRSSRDPLEQLENLESTNIAVNRNDSGW